jgi:hypothetical protein
MIIANDKDQEDTHWQDKAEISFQYAIGAQEKGFNIIFLLAPEPL